MCRVDDPQLPAPWIRRLWRTIVIGGVLWLLFAPEARGARPPQADDSLGAVGLAIGFVPTADVPGTSHRVHAPSAR